MAAAEGIKQSCIIVPSLPDVSAPEMDFHDTSFFQTNQLSARQLPTPDEVLARLPRGFNGVARFEEFNLIVKVGQLDYYSADEALTMRVLKQLFPDGEVPVPEVFGWKTCPGQPGRIFIYMSLEPGKTISEVWPSLTGQEKEVICGELRQIVLALRRITQEEPDHWIGKPEALQAQLLRLLSSSSRVCK